MTCLNTIVGLSVVTGLVIALTPQSSSADDTNAASARILDCEFRNAPAFTLIGWVTRLSHEPVVVPYNFNFLVTYKTERKLTRDEAIQAFDGIFQANGYRLVKPDESYYRVVKVSETNSVANRSHIDLEIQGDRVVLNGNTTIDLKDLATTLATLSNSGTEIWVHHLVTRSWGAPSNEAAELLASPRGLDANKMFLKYVPEGK